MVLFGNRKYACLSCIRGHRSSSCEHRDRILLQVRKPGRKSQTEPKSRFALVAKESSPSVTVKKESDYKLVKVPDVKHPGMMNHLGHEEEPTTFEDDDVVVTEKYVFVHVGGNMFKREVRPGYRSMSASPRSSVGSAQASPCTSSTPCLKSPDGELRVPSADGVLSPILNTSRPLTRSSPHRQQQSHSVTMENRAHPLNTHVVPAAGHSYQELLAANGHNITGVDYREARKDETLSHSESDAQMDSYSSRSSELSEDLAPPLTNEPPLVIGPMQFQHDIEGRQANILNELGLSIEEASQIWSGDVNSGEFSFASQCVLPGQCQCGDGCECPDCYEHQRLRHRKATRKDLEKQAA